jgi:hypothetical protein
MQWIFTNCVKISNILFIVPEELAKNKPQYD